MLHIKCRTHRYPRVVAGRGDIDIFERRLAGHLSVGHAVLSHTTGNTDIIKSSLFMKCRHHVEDHFLRSPLHGSREVLMILGKRFFGFARRSKNSGHLFRVQRRHKGLVILPITNHTRCARPEELQVKPEQSVGSKFDHLLQFVGVKWFTIGRHAHHFIFIPVKRKSQQLGKRSIKDPY